MRTQLMGQSETECCSSMQNIRVQKSQLLEKLKENRKNHRKVFEEALEGYRKEVISVLEQKLEDARHGKRVTHYIELAEPMDQTKDYNRAIQMLEMSIDNTMEITQSEFAQYVMDDWAWKDQFLTCNSAYSATAARAMSVR